MYVCACVCGGGSVCGGVCVGECVCGGVCVWGGGLLLLQTLLRKHMEPLVWDTATIKVD